MGYGSIFHRSNNEQLTYTCMSEKISVPAHIMEKNIFHYRAKSNYIVQKILILHPYIP